MQPTPNRRILIVDDNAAIHRDFRKILEGNGEAEATRVSASEAALFGGDESAKAAPSAKPVETAPAHGTPYSIDSAMQGEEAVRRVEDARKEQLPYAMAFVDVRMPPGWDGVETAQRIWAVEPDLQIVICTAFSDYTWPQTVGKLGRTDRLLILKKPFDPVEVCQLAAALTEKWNVTQRERQNLQTAIRAEMEARAYAASLETVNRALESSWAKSERELERQRKFLLRIATDVLAPAQSLILEQVDIAALERGDSAAMHALDRAGDRASALVTALGAIVELASIDAGTAHPQRVECSPWSIASEVTELARKCAAGGVEINVSRAPDVPDSIVSDPLRLRQILGELVGNAVRHTKQGAVRIELALGDAHGSHDPALRIKVSDSGCGLSRESLAHLFEPFPGKGEPTPGPHTGLGLAVCKRAAALLGGELHCDNTVAQGACFTLSLPLPQTQSR